MNQYRRGQSPMCYRYTISQYWSRHRDLNTEPIAYKTIALPLSYDGTLSRTVGAARETLWRFLNYIKSACTYKLLISLQRLTRLCSGYTVFRQPPATLNIHNGALCMSPEIAVNSYIISPQSEPELKPFNAVAGAPSL